MTNESSWRGGERLRSLVSMLGIEDRLILEGTDHSALDLKAHIDYAKINRILDAKREESKNWLRGALELGKAFSSSYDTYDILSERIDKNMVDLQKILEETKGRQELERMLERTLREKNARAADRISVCRTPCKRRSATAFSAAAV